MLIIAGVIILAGRRLLVPRVRATTSPVDYLALILLLIIIITGVVPTIFINLLGHGTTTAPPSRRSAACSAFPRRHGDR